DDRLFCHDENELEVDAVGFKKQKGLSNWNSLIFLWICCCHWVKHTFIKIYWRQDHPEDLKVFILIVSYPLTKIN
uniref:hypothetical protein n=1 Tax=Escherichia coli TaxID=562 RepID=UPI001BC8C877